jgi:hypothetical protein
MNGGRTVTDDTCLYAEALALRTAQEQPSGVLQNQLTLGLRYYFGVAPLPVRLLSDACQGCSRTPTDSCWPSSLSHVLPAIPPAKLVYSKVLKRHMQHHVNV